MGIDSFSLAEVLINQGYLVQNMVKAPFKVSYARAYHVPRPNPLIGL